MRKRVYRVLLVAVSVILATEASVLRAQVPDLYDEQVFRTIELTFADADWHQILINNKHLKDQDGINRYLSADLSIDGTLFENVGVQYKGNSSFSVEGKKRPYKITTDAFVSGQRIWGYDKITLNNGVFDPTKIREVISYKILREFMPAPRANLVFVRSGTAGRLEDIGVYTSVERVNKRFMNKHFPHDDGHRYKAVRGSMNWLGAGKDAYKSRYSAKGGEQRTRYDDLIHVIDVLNNTGPGALRRDLDAIFNIDKLLWQLAGAISMLNWDDLRAFPGGGHNYYLYEDAYNGRMQILPWDWDLGWAESVETSYDLFDSFDNSDLPLTRRVVLGIPAIKDRYLAHLREMRSRIDWSTIEADVQRYRGWTDSVICTAEEAKLWWEPCQTRYSSSHNTLRNQITQRRSYLDARALLNRPVATISDVKHTPKLVDSRQAVTVTARISASTDGLREALLYFRTRGKYGTVPMLDDGAHGDGEANDGVFGARIPAQAGGERVEYYIETSSNDTAGGSTGAKKYSPIYAEYKPYDYLVRSDSFDSPIVINEFVADNVAGLKDEAGENDDWVELYNSGNTAINLKGYFLSDDTGDPQRWVFPDVTIAAGGFLLVWADKDPEQGSLHATFKLSKSGESVAFFAPISEGNGLIDSYDFGRQAEDQSEGRECDSSKNWIFFATPTPRASNGCTCSGSVDPSEVTGLRLSGKNSTTLSWTAQANARYDIAGGMLAALRSAGSVSGAACLENDVATEQWTDARAHPAAADGYYYLVRAQLQCGVGGYGTSSGGGERQPDQSCR